MATKVPEYVHVDPEDVMAGMIKRMADEHKAMEEMPPVFEAGNMIEAVEDDGAHGEVEPEPATPLASWAKK